MVAAADNCRQVERTDPPCPEANIIKKKDDYGVVLFHILRVKYGIKILNMSCLKSTTYWVSLFHILHVKYGIKRHNSLSFFFIILASDHCG